MVEKMLFLSIQDRQDRPIAFAFLYTYSTAIEVRVFSPHLDIFKGMLAQKCGITTIQLTTSMRKVPGSLTAEPSDDWASLLRRNPAPSKFLFLIFTWGWISYKQTYPII